MKKIIFLFLLSCGLMLTSAYSQVKDSLAIRNLLEQQTREWNAGHIEAFMNGYWKNDSLMFIGKTGVTYGWQSTLNNYIRSYPDTMAMGKLKFNLLKFNRIAKDYFFVVGQWHLTRKIGDLSGVFTLLFRKINNTWVIIADHSS